MEIESSVDVSMWVAFAFFSFRRSFWRLMQIKKSNNHLLYCPMQWTCFKEDHDLWAIIPVCQTLQLLSILKYSYVRNTDTVSNFMEIYHQPPGLSLFTKWSLIAYRVLNTSSPWFTPVSTAAGARRLVMKVPSDNTPRIRKRYPVDGHATNRWQGCMKVGQQ